MDNCSWDNPGAAPFRGGDVRAAIHAYGFPMSVEEALVASIVSGREDAVVFIGRDGITAPYGTASNLRDMHHSGGRLCRGVVTRAKWKDNQQHPALVYCRGIYCVAVPVVCGNISRIDYTPAMRNFQPIIPSTRVNNVSIPSTAFLVALVLPLLLRR